MSLQPSKPFLCTKTIETFYFFSSKSEQTGSEPIIPRILTYERNYRFFLLHCHYIHCVENLHNLALFLLLFPQILTCGLLWFLASIWLWFFFLPGYLFFHWDTNHGGWSWLCLREVETCILIKFSPLRKLGWNALSPNLQRKLCGRIPKPCRNYNLKRIIHPKMKICLKFTFW